MECCRSCLVRKYIPEFFFFQAEKKEVGRKVYFLFLFCIFTNLHWFNKLKYGKQEIPKYLRYLSHYNDVFCSFKKRNINIYPSKINIFQASNSSFFFYSCMFYKSTTTLPNEIRRNKQYRLNLGILFFLATSLI